MAMVFKIWHFCNIEICENTQSCQKVLIQQKCPLKTSKSKYLKWFWPVTEGITLLTWKIIKKSYIEDFIFKPFTNQKIFKNYKSGQNNQKKI